MKKTIKAMSLILTLVMLATAFVIPTSAVKGQSEIKFDIEQCDPATVNGCSDVYKLTISVKHPNPVPTLTLPFVYDKTKFLPCSKTKEGVLSYDKTFGGPRGDAICNLLGDYNDSNYYTTANVVDNDVGTIAGAKYSNFNALPKRGTEPSNLGTLDPNIYAPLIFQASIAVDTRYLVARTLEPIMEVFFYKNPAAATVEGAEFGLIDGCKNATFTESSTGFEYHHPSAKFSDDVDYTAINAKIAAPVVTGPKLVKSNSQIKFYGTKPTASDNFDYRLISKITDADWTKYFANTGVANATTNAITEAGFVAHDAKGGAFDLATAQNVAKGTPTAGYITASTTYVSKTTGTDATFGCRITDVLHSTQVTDIDCLAYVKYLDNAGTAQYIFYDAAINAAVATNYNTALNAWKAA